MEQRKRCKIKRYSIVLKTTAASDFILQNYMFERFMLRLANSDYEDRFIIKGGMLVDAIVGLDNRATMDLNSTLKKFPLNPDSILKALNEICAVNADDNIIFGMATLSRFVMTVFTVDF